MRSPRSVMACSSRRADVSPPTTFSGCDRHVDVEDVADHLRVPDDPVILPTRQKRANCTLHGNTTMRDKGFRAHAKAGATGHPTTSTIPPVTAYDDLADPEHLDASSLPPRQQRILATIRDSVLEHGYSPSTREIGEAVGLRSSSSVSKHLASLEEKGFLRRSTSVSRPIDVRLFLRGSRTREPAEDSVAVPVVGHIAAGSPIAAEEHVDDVLKLPRELPGRAPVSALRVRGNSMVDAAICDADILVVRQQAEAPSGQNVAAMIDGEATVKVYRRRDG